jgi:tetratricopeptide (TPR) repeat protein
MEQIEQYKDLSPEGLATLESFYQLQTLEATEQIKTAAEQQRDLLEREKRIRLAVALMLAFVVLTVLFWFLAQYLKVLAKYAKLIELLREVIRLGYYDLTSAVGLAWSAEFPNFTGLLFSRILNRNFPKAVALAFYTYPYSNYFNLNNPQEAAVYLAKMEEYSNFNGDASAQEIICGAWGFGEGIDDCVDDCPIPHIAGAGEIASDAVYATAMGLFIGASVFFMFTGGVAAALLIGAGAIGGAVGVGTSIAERNRNLERCRNLDDLPCSVDVEEQCKI